MKKFILSFIFICINALASTPNVVLLSSIDTPRIWYHSQKWEIEQSLELIFKNRFNDSGYNLVIKSKVDQHTLRNELSNPKNIAVFWVSHSAGGSTISDGISSKSAIVDYYGKDVKDLFKDIHPNIRFLGLVGCNAKSVIKEYEDKGYYNDSSSLKIHAFNKKVDARVGLRTSIKKSASQLGEIDKRFLSYPKIYSTPSVVESFNNDTSCKKLSSGFKVNLTRHAHSDAPAIAVKSQGNILALLPAIKKGQETSQEFFVENTADTIHASFKFSLDSNIHYSPKKLYLGEFDIQAAWDGDWNVFARRDGEPLGVTKNLYRYTGKMPSIEYASSYQKYMCLDDLQP